MLLFIIQITVETVFKEKMSSTYFFLVPQTLMWDGCCRPHKTKQNKTSKHSDIIIIIIIVLIIINKIMINNANSTH